MSGVKIGGAWHTPGSVSVKVAGSWRNVATVSTKVAGTWRISTMGSPPAAPVMGYVSTGVFSVTNPVAGAVYTPTLISGSGTAAWSAGTSRFTISSTTARFSVTAGWASNAPQSAVDYMELFPYAWTPDTRTYGTCGGNTTGGECTHSFPVTPPCGGGNCSTGCENPSWCCDARNPSVYHPPYTCQTGGSAPAFIDYSSSGYTDSGSEWYKVA